MATLPTSSLLDPITTIMRRYLVIVMSRGLNPPATATSSKYPVYEALAPNEPDKCIILFETNKVIQGRHMNGGAVIYKHGCLLQVRNPNYVEGHNFMNILAKEITESDSGPALPFPLANEAASAIYTIHNIQIASGPIHIGIEKENRRHLWSLNLLIALTIAT